MPRHRPELRGWDDTWVNGVVVSDPESWVRAVLATPLIAAASNPRIVEAAFEPRRRIRKSDRDFLPPFIFGMRYGEISEAIRRILERRESQEPEQIRRSDYRVFKDANLKTNRGLHALEAKRALAREGKLYRMSPEWAWFDVTARGLESFVPLLTSGTMNLEHQVRRLKGRLFLEARIQKRGARSPEFYYGAPLPV